MASAATGGSINAFIAGVAQAWHNGVSIIKAKSISASAAAGDNNGVAAKNHRMRQHGKSNGRASRQHGDQRAKRNNSMTSAAMARSWQHLWRSEKLKAWRGDAVAASA